MRTFGKMSLAALAIGAVGCGGGPGSKALSEMDDAPLTSEAEIANFSNGSALKVYMVAAGMRGMASEIEGSCPSVKVDGNTTTITGDCTDSEGNKFTGRAVIKLDAAGSKTGTTTFDGFGTESQGTCESGSKYTEKVLVDGTSKLGGTQTEGTFDIDLVVEQTGVEDEGNCVSKTQRIAYDYSGELDGPLPLTEDDAMSMLRDSTWNGRGRMGATGFGVVSLETKNEVLNPEKCSFEALSGTTTITAGKNEAVITYDGAAQCTPASAATWTLNGVSQGSMIGIGCSALGGGAMSAWGLLALGGLVLRRRRNS